MPSLQSLIVNNCSERTQSEDRGSGMKSSLYPMLAGELPRTSSAVVGKSPA
jgi:hypothetical protein